MKSFEKIDNRRYIFMEWICLADFCQSSTTGVVLLCSLYTVLLPVVATIVCLSAADAHCCLSYYLDSSGAKRLFSNRKLQMLAVADVYTTLSTWLFSDIGDVA